MLLNFLCDFYFYFWSFKDTIQHLMNWKTRNIYFLPNPSFHDQENYTGL